MAHFKIVVDARDYEYIDKFKYFIDDRYYVSDENRCQDIINNGINKLLNQDNYDSEDEKAKKIVLKKEL